MTPEDLQKLWREQQEKLNRAEILNNKVVGELTREKAKSLAPFSFAMIGLLAAIFAFGIYYSIAIDPMYCPVPLLCVVGIVMQWFKIKMRRSISDAGNSIIDRELGVLRCRRNFRLMWIVTWILFVPYILWFNWWMKALMSDGARHIVMAVTIAGSVVVFVIHVCRVTCALRQIDRYTAYLKEF